MTQRLLPSTALLCILASACGPSILLPSDDAAGTSGGMTTDGPGPTVTTTSPPPPPPPDTSISTTSPATTIATGLDTSDESDDGSFLSRPDGGYCLVSDDGFWLCSECDVFAQDCPSGEKCMPWANDGGSAWNATRCYPIVEDPAAPGDACTVEDSPVSGFDDCDGTSMCWGVELETLEGTCAAMCTGGPENPQCPPSTTCIIANDGVIALCLPTCNPLGDDCGPSEVCLSNGDGFVCYPGSTERAQAGEPCEYVNSCDSGLTCQPSVSVAPTCDLGFGGCCTPWCDLSAPDPTLDCFDPAQQCVSSWNGDPAPEGLENLGVCLLPAP